MADLLLGGACVLYALGWMGFLGNHTGLRPSWGVMARRVLGVATVLHASALVERWVALGVPPVTSGFEGLSLVSLLLAGIFLWQSRKQAVASLGVFVAPLSLLHLAASLMLSRSGNGVPDALKSVHFYVHIAPAFLGDAFLAMAAVACAAYLAQERTLRLKMAGMLGGRMTSLTAADTLAYRCTTLGFLFMSLGIVTGAIYAKLAWHSYWSWDPRQVISLVTWLVYAAILHARFTSGWRGRRWAWLTVGAFTLVVGSAVLLDVLQLGRHGGDFDAAPRTAEAG